MDSARMTHHAITCSTGAKIAQGRHEHFPFHRDNAVGAPMASAKPGEPHHIHSAPTEQTPPLSSALRENGAQMDLGGRWTRR
jgi:hypothetical protein